MQRLVESVRDDIQKGLDTLEAAGKTDTRRMRMATALFAELSACMAEMEIANNVCDDAESIEDDNNLDIACEYLIDRRCYAQSLRDAIKTVLI